MAAVTAQESIGVPRAAERESKAPLRRLVTVGLVIAVVPIVCGALMRTIPFDAVTPIAQLVAYTPYLAIPAIVVTGLCALARRWRLTAFAGVSALALLAWNAPFYVGYLSPPDERAADLRVMSVNALYGQADAATIVDLVRGSDVDVLVVVELTADLRERLTAQGLDDLMPYQVDERVGAEAAGSGIWSTSELNDVAADTPGTFAMPAATVRTARGEARVTAVHPVPPVPAAVSLWRSELDELAANIGQSDADFEVYAGDFNATYDHASYRALLGEGFVDATRDLGRGLNPSWSWGGNGLLPVDLDHIVTNAGVLDVSSLSVPGSDHRAVLASLTFD